MRALDDETHATIKRLCAEGDALAEEGAYREAIARYNEV